MRTVAQTYQLAPEGTERHAWNMGPFTKTTNPPRHTPADLVQYNGTPSRKSVSERITAWLKTCNKEHGDHCKSIWKQEENPLDSRSRLIDPLRVPFWLIDVNACCIGRAAPSDQYMALSYVWEAPEHRSLYIMLSKETLEDLQKPQAFTKREKHIPRAVREAMKLAADLEIQYLWVDRFCIVQDDDTTKYHQINNMASIYANAYLTVVAGAGDALDPLECGIRRRILPPTLEPRRTREELLNTSKWATRAWTLQELLFSRRAVFFLEGRLAWECHCDIWEEPDQKHSSTPAAAKRCLNRFMGTTTGLQHTSWPDMDEYSEIVADYSCRCLTYDSDTVPAFLGVTNVLSNSFLGGFVFGLPALFIDAALLWRPSAKIVRRNTGIQGFTLPSWSWMGWTFHPTPVDTTLWKAACNYVQNPGHWKRGNGRTRDVPLNYTSLQPTVTWFLGPPEDRCQIQNLGFQWQHIEGDQNATVPDGWKKNSGSFQHASDLRSLFNYPVPMVDHVAKIDVYTTSSSQSPTSSLLFFKTARSYLKVQFYCRKNLGCPGDDIAIANIFDRSGSWAGHFRSNDMNLGLKSRNHDGREALEFIAISEGSEHGGSHVFDMEYASKHMDEQGTLRFVNVLWIEWVEGIAYRRGLGHIVRSAWDRQVKEGVDVRLG
jgi:hypothetical protein